MPALAPFLWLVSNKTGRIVSAAILFVVIAAPPTWFGSVRFEATPSRTSSSRAKHRKFSTCTALLTN